MKILLLISLFAALTACSSGGNESNANDNVDMANNTSPGIVSGQVTAGQTGLLFATGPAIVSETGNTLSGIDTIWQAENGWILMSGFIEFSSSALWRGQHGNAQVILSTGDNITGFPANITFDTAVNAMIKDNGSVLALVNLGGAGQGSSALIEITPDGNVIGRLRPGDSIASDTLMRIESLIDGGTKTYMELFVNSEFGSLVIGELTATGADIVVSTDQGPDQTDTPVIIDGCEIYYEGNFSGHGISANRQGDLVFNATQYPVGNTQCDRRAVIVYSNTSFERRTTEEMLFTGPGDPVNFYNLLGIAEDQTVFLISEFFYSDNSNSSVVSIWAIDSAGNQSLFALSNETMSPDFTERTTFGSTDLSVEKRNASFDSTSGNHAVVLATNALRNNRVLSGASRPLPYADLRNPGASPLTRITGALSDTVPGLTDSSFFSSVENVRITADKTVWFKAIAEDASGSRLEHSGVWQALPDETPQPLVNFSDSYSHLGGRIALSEIESYLVSDGGDLLVHGFASKVDDPTTQYEVVIYRRGTE